MNDIVELQSGPLDAGAAIEAAGAGEAGAVAVFLGTTRGETSESGQELVALDYEAYGEMAIGQMKKLAEEARTRWPIIRIVLLHRTGRVAVGQPSVLVAVSTPHRAEAFDACRFLIDRLKGEVAIWKKEEWKDGSTSWVKGNS